MEHINKSNRSDTFKRNIHVHEFSAYKNTNHKIPDINESKTQSLLRMFAYKTRAQKSGFQEKQLVKVQGQNPQNNPQSYAET